MLQIVVDDINDVNEELRSYYVEKDGKFMLEADYSSAGLEDVTNLKSSYSRIKEERNTLRDKYTPLKKFERLLEVEGFDVDEVDELMAKAQSANNPEAVEKLQREYEKKLSKQKDEFTSLQNEYDNTKGNLTDLIVANQLTTAAISAGVIKNSVDDVVSLTRSKFQLDEKGKVQVLDEDGDPMGITPTEFFSKVYKDQKPHFYEATNAAGSGAPHSTNSGGSNVKSWSDAKTLKDKVAAVGNKIGN